MIKLSFCQNDSPMGGSFWKKGQLDHSYTFWTMPILIFSPGANFGHHPMILLSYVGSSKILPNESFVVLYLIENSSGVFDRFCHFFQDVWIWRYLKLSFLWYKALKKPWLWDTNLSFSLIYDAICQDSFYSCLDMVQIG